MSGNTSLAESVDLSHRHLRRLVFADFTREEQEALHTSVRHADLSNNLITSPVGLMQLSHLTRLDLSYNAMDSLQGTSEAPVFPPRLTHLNLSHNSLTTLRGDALTSLAMLRELDLSHNALHHVDGLHSPTLRKLIISHNQLEHINGVEKCRALHTLDVSHNMIQDVEHLIALRHLVELQRCRLHHNPITCRRAKMDALRHLQLLRDGALVEEEDGDEAEVEDGIMSSPTMEQCTSSSPVVSVQPPAVSASSMANIEEVELPQADGDAEKSTKMILGCSSAVIQPSSTSRPPHNSNNTRPVMAPNSSRTSKQSSSKSSSIPAPLPPRPAAPLSALCSNIPTRSPALTKIREAAHDGQIRRSICNGGSVDCASMDNPNAPQHRDDVRRVASLFMAALRR